MKPWMKFTLVAGMLLVLATLIRGFGAEAGFGYGLGLLFGVFFTMLTILGRFILPEVPEAEGHDFELIDLKRTENELLCLADTWALVQTYGEKCDWTWEELSQDDAVELMGMLSTCLDGEQICMDDDEFREMRHKHLAQYREAHPSETNLEYDGPAERGGAADETAS